MSFTFSSPRKQYFSFPPDVIKYLLKNPISVKGLLKLYQTCKYFFSHRQIVIINPALLYGNIPGKPRPFGFLINNFPKELWLDNFLKLQYSDLLPLPKIYRSTLFCLTVFHSRLTLAEFQILTAENTIKNCNFERGSVCDVNNDNVPLDVILQNLPNVRRFTYGNFSESYSSETLKRMNKIKFSNPFLYFELNFLDSTFDPLLLCEFIKINGNDKSMFQYYCRQNVQDFYAAAKELLKFWEGKKPQIIINRFELS